MQNSNMAAILSTMNEFSIHVVQLITIIIAAALLQQFGKQVITQIIRHTIRSSKYETKDEEIKREDTLISITYTALKAIIWISVGLTFLSIFGINVGPLLAGAGIAGVALGFGAQSIVKDFLAGIFILAENQYRVGDVIEVNQDVSGTVEKVSLRMTVLRDLEGRVHYVPNGTIQIATNLTMEYANVELDVSVSYDSDIDLVEKTINKVGQHLYADPEWKGIALEAPYMLRVDRFETSAIVVKIVCKTAPIKQWTVKSEILRQLKKAFDKEGIEIPHPQMVVHQAKDLKHKTHTKS